MRKFYFLLVVIAVFYSRVFSINDTLHVYYLENFPYSYTENKDVKGLEIDIIKEYVKWAKNDGVNLIIDYKVFSEFDKLFEAVSKAKDNVIGLGSVTIKPERLKDVSFSPPYLKNVSILVTNTTVVQIQNKNEVSKTLAKQRAVTLKNSVYEKFLLDIKKKYLPKLSISYTDSEFSAIDSVAAKPGVFAYCDVLSYWTYGRNNKDKPLRIQKFFTHDADNLGFIFPKRSNHEKGMSEFFESEFGFICSKQYTDILEKHLNHEVMETVKVN